MFHRGVTEAVSRKYTSKSEFLKNSQVSPENICVEVTF